MTVAARADLPHFRYHDDPLGSGAIVPSDVTCQCCGQQRGFAYSGPVFSERDDLYDALCPWCVADGSAAARFDASFVSADAELMAIPAEARDELARRTVSYTGWQEAEWRVHCNDAMAFVAMVDGARIRLYPDALADLRRMVHMWDDAQFEEFVGALRADGSPTAYLFRCLHCDAHRAHADFD